MDQFIIFTGTLESPLSSQNVYVLSPFVKNIISSLKLYKTLSEFLKFISWVIMGIMYKKKNSLMTA